MGCWGKPRPAGGLDLIAFIKLYPYLMQVLECIIRWSIFDASHYYQVVDQAAGEQAALVEAVKQLGVLVKSITSTGEACLQVEDILFKNLFIGLCLPTV